MARRPVGRALEMGVAETAVAAARDHRPLTHLGQISEQGLAVFLVDLCSGRYLQHDIGAARAVAVFAHAGVTVVGPKVLLVAVGYEWIQAVDRLYDDVAALTSVAAVRSTELDKLLAPERHAAVPAVARADVDLGFIEEFHEARYATARAKIREPARTPARTAH